MIKGDNYPIKYAIWEIIKNDETIAHIISKAYIVSESIYYFGNGSSKKEYVVVFPIKNQYSIEKQLPNFNIWSEKCYNGNEVEEVYDTFEEAKKIANMKNSNVRKEHISNDVLLIALIDSNIIKKLKDDFDN